MPTAIPDKNNLEIFCFISIETSLFQHKHTFLFTYNQYIFEMKTTKNRLFYTYNFRSFLSKSIKVVV